MHRNAINNRLLMAGLVAFVWFFVFLSQTQAVQPDIKPQKVVSVEGITEYKLDNGFRYLLFPDPSSATVTVNLTVFVGSRHEGYGETGMAHLLEHMVFKGSKLYPQIDKALEKHGARANGTTFVDRTNYYETMPATDENLEFGIKFEADRLVNSFIKREDLAKEMTVVRNEFEMGENNPIGILQQRMLATAFEWHNYGKETIGNRSDIERVPIERLQKFYRKYYQPDNVLLAIAGKFDEAKAHKYIAQYFGVLPRPQRKLDNTYTEEPPQDGERIVTLRRVGKLTVVGVVYHTPAAAHPDCAAAEVLAQVLTSTPSGRLYKALVETKKATAIGGFATAWHDPGVMMILTLVSDDSNPEEVKDTLLKEIEHIAKKPITKEEMERAKKELLAERQRALANSKEIAIELSEWAGAGDWRLMFLHRDRIKNLKVEHVNKVAQKYLKRSNRTFGVFIPTEPKEIARAEIPATPSFEEVFKNFKGGEGLAKGEAFDPTPENIEKRVQRMELPGGLKVSLLPKKTRGEKVVASLRLRFGNKDSLLHRKTVAGFLGYMMMRGTKKYSYEDIQTKLDELGATINAGSGAGTLTFSIEAKRDTLPEVLDLLEEIIRHPTFPQKEFDILKGRILQGYKEGLTDPQTLAFNKLRRKLNPYPKDHIQYIPTIEESIERVEKVTRDQVAQIYQEQVGASAGQLAIVGDFDLEPTVERIKTLLGNWKARTPFEYIRKTPKTDIPGGQEVIIVPDKKNANYVGGYLFAMKDTDPRYPAMKMASFILGESGFTSLLMDNLRTKEGLSYGAGSHFAAGNMDEYTLFLLYASCNPKNIDKVHKVTFAILNKTRKEGITQKQLEEAQKAYLLKQKVTRSSDSTLASLLRQLHFLDRTFEHYGDLDRSISQLTLKEVNEALRSLIQPKRLVVIQAGDLEK